MKELIREEIVRYAAEYHAVRTTETSWQKPLVGFASADDPLFVKLQQVVSPAHAMPEDILAGARTVISFFIPFSRTVAISNTKGKRASREWKIAYIETNQLISDINGHMKSFVEDNGFAAETTPPTENYDPDKLMSDWSHRHIAFIAGLGRFGLNNMLITEKGCCGRLGSVLTTLDLEPDRRASSEACLYYHDGSCGRCAERCVNDALFTGRFNRRKCYEMLIMNGEQSDDSATADVCGKCLVGLPCSFGNPVFIKSR